ncbi:MAG TPA: DUF885 domain-containing protein [Bryobacteraceae bacterium]|jgi:uncharacterized protein (DUF885 family)
MRLVVIFVSLLPLSVFAQTPAWVAKSNQSAQLLIDIQARYSPEGASRNGVAGLDDKTTVLSADRQERQRRDWADAQKKLQARLAAETDPLVRQDLEILLGAVDRSIRASEANEKYLLSFYNVPGIVFSGVQSLLDDQTAPARRQAAVSRIRKYAGLEQGYTPIATLAEERFRESLKTPGRVGPSRAEVESDLQNSAAFVNGIGLLLEKYKLPGYQEPFAKLRTQLAAYDNFVRAEVLPKTRTDFRLPPEIYKLSLENYGVDYTPDELTSLAHRAFTEIQDEMRPLAAKIAKARNLKSSDYRDVIQALKKEQLPGDQILPHYKKRLEEIEAIVRSEHLITLPDRPAIIHLATAAETAQQPAPHMVPPPLMNNHGERGAFVLPLGTTGQGGESMKYDDFTFAAASWTLTAHEARPGHELQFDAMVERGVSLARGLFAFNSTNVEGWGLYAEWFMLPYMPDEGKLVSLDYRLLRAARAFLDPELQQGKLTPEQAMQVLEKDVVCSKAFATEEVERFTFRMPGQAVSYFDGYTRLRDIRSSAEKAMGARFNVQKFHDFVLAQGLLPPNLLKKAVMEQFVKE